MDENHLIIYIVCGVIGFLAVLVAVVAAILICREKKDKHPGKRGREKGKGGKVTNKKAIAFQRPKPPRSTYESVQPLTDSEIGRTHSRSLGSNVSHDSARSASSNSHVKANPRGKRFTEGSRDAYATDGGDTSLTDESDVDFKTYKRKLYHPKTSSISTSSLLQLPIDRTSGRTSSCSGTSVSDADEEDKEDKGHNLGKIHFSLHYDFQSLTLVLKVVKAANLPAKDISGTSDPYVRIMLLPDKKHRLETKVKHKCLNPVWNESFMFEGFPYEKLKTRTLHLEVLDKDRFSADDPIGEIYVPLSDMNLSTLQDHWRHLQPVDHERYRLGEILLSLAYDPNTADLTINVIKCKDLKRTDLLGKSDPYVKIWMLQNGRKVDKRKTGVVKRQLNPVFNETFVYNIQLTSLRDTQFLVSVMDHDVVSRNDQIGSVLVGAQTGPSESKQWGEMLTKSKVPVAAWHMLRK